MSSYCFPISNINRCGLYQEFSNSLFILIIFSILTDNTRNCWVCPFLQPAIPALLAASGAPEFGPSCTTLFGNSQWRKTRWKGNILEAFSRKTKDTVSSTNSRLRMQPRQPTTSTTGICAHLFACPAQVTPAHAEHFKLSIRSLAFSRMDNSGKDFRVGIWTHAPIMSC